MYDEVQCKQSANNTFTKQKKYQTSTSVDLCTVAVASRTSSKLFEWPRLFFGYYRYYYYLFIFIASLLLKKLADVSAKEENWLISDFKHEGSSKFCSAK